MNVPDWRIYDAGARIRVALWLHSEVGSGGTFTKADLRDAFPGVEQIDRRMRDLRPEGWIITTYQEDRSLSARRAALSRRGRGRLGAWLPVAAARAITAKERQATMLADGFVCVLCGIAGGEAYPDDSLRTAKLAVVRRLDGEGHDRRLLHILRPVPCRSHRRGTRHSLVSEIDTLSPEQRGRLAEWVRRGSRPRTKEEELWGRYRRLPPTDRAAVEQLLQK